MASKGLAHAKCAKPIKHGETTELSVDLPGSCYVCGGSMMTGDTVLHFDDAIHFACASPLPQVPKANWELELLAGEKGPDSYGIRKELGLFPEPPKPSIQMVDTQDVANKLLEKLLPRMTDSILPAM